MSVVRHVSCDDDTTRKTLWRLHDGTLVESVLMRYPDRVTMCISSQAGCGMNCPFCATGQAGLDRNLSTAEIVHQIVDGMRALRDGEVPGGPARLSNIVFMGMGEPLANYKRVVGAIRRLTDPEPDGLGLSQRGITVSTVGLVPAMLPLRRRGLQVPARRLAARAGRRAARHPRPRQHALEGARGAGRGLGVRREVRPPRLHRVRADQGHQRPGVARAICWAGCSRASRVHVNLIPLNPTPGSKWTASRPEDEAAFVAATGGARGAGDRPGHPGPGDRRRLRAAGGDRALTGAGPGLKGVLVASTGASSSHTTDSAPEQHHIRQGSAHSAESAAVRGSRRPSNLARVMPGRKSDSSR